MASGAVVSRSHCSTSHQPGWRGCRRGIGGGAGTTSGLQSKTQVAFRKVSSLSQGDDGDLAYAEMHEMQPPGGGDVWCANVHEASDARFKRRCNEHEKSPSRSSGA